MSDLKNIRFDTVKIPKVRKTDDGFLEGEVIAGRAGVFAYESASSSIIYELRHPDDVFHEDSLKTLKMLPVTDDHPNEFVNAHNASKLQKGFTGESCRIHEDKIITSIKITDADLIKQIENGQKSELSYGYECVVTKEDGIYNGQKYTHRQKLIRYNHLAAVPLGRAGREARFRLDSENYKHVAECIFKENLNLEENNMSNQDDKTQHLDKELEVKVARYDALVAEKKLVESERDNWKIKHDSLQQLCKKKDEALEEYKVKASDENITQKVIDRVCLILGAAKALGDDVFAYAKHTDREIMEYALGMRDKKYDFAGRSDEYVKGLFEAQFGQLALPQAKNDSAKMLAALAKMTDSVRKEPASTMDIASSINKMQADVSNKTH
jgi:hypothetical protein